MTRVLAFMDDSPCAADVHRTAKWMATLLGATIDPVRAQGPEPDGGPGGETPPGLRLVPGPTIEALTGELTAPDVATAVVGSRAIDAKVQPLGHVAHSLLTRTGGPLVVVPPDARASPAETPRLLVPLDGTDETTAALLPLAEQMAQAGATVVVVHVFDADSLPAFIGSPEDVETLAAELAQHHLPGLAQRCELRVGDPASEIIGVVDTEAPDAVLLAWRQDLAPGHAEVMRRLLNDARVPLVVVPLHPAA